MIKKIKPIFTKAWGKKISSIDKMMKKLKLMSTLVKGRDILDVGFATNPNPFLKDAIGVDIQKVPKPENYKKIYRLNLNKDKLPFKNNSFDTIIAGDVIEHLENPYLLLKECNRVLRHNGKLIITTPNPVYFWVVIKSIFCKMPKKESLQEVHLYNWTIFEMVNLLKHAGFKCLKLWGTIIRIPLIMLEISTVKVPALSTIIIYECQKVGEPAKYTAIKDSGKKLRKITI